MLQWDLMCHIHCVIVAAEANWLQIKQLLERNKHTELEGRVDQLGNHRHSNSKLRLWFGETNRNDKVMPQVGHPQEGDGAAADDASDPIPEANGGCIVS